METMTQEVNRQVLLYAVQRKMFCDITGQILDVRDSVLVTGEKDGQTVVNLCVKGTAWDDGAEDAKAKAEDLGVVLDIIDGRNL
jgi:hypothetical protein